MNTNQNPFFSRLIDTYCASISRNLNDFLFQANKLKLETKDLTTEKIINGLYDIAKENKTSSIRNISELGAQKIYDLLGNPLCTVNFPNRSDLTEKGQKILTIFDYLYPLHSEKEQSDHLFENSYYFREYLKKDETATIIDEILKLKVKNKLHNNFLPASPELYLISECLSRGIQQLKFSQKHTFQEMESIMNRNTSFINGLIKCNVDIKNYSAEGLRQLLVPLLCNGECTFDYIFYLSNERFQTLDGNITPLIIIENEDPIIIEHLKFYFSKHSKEIDLAKFLLKILESDNNQNYIESIREQLMKYCHEIDERNALNE
ncbi:MAG: hypothetical protein ACI4JM_11450 [Oscillospiraceae bacterium]